MLTRIAEEGRLARGTDRFLRELGLSTAADGANLLIGDAMEDALIRLGYVVATPGSVSDSDLAAVVPGRVEHFRLQARVYLLRSILTNVAAIVSEQDGPSMAQYSDMARSLRLAIADEQAVLDSRYATGSGRVVSGTPCGRIPDALWGRRHAGL